MYHSTQSHHPLHLFIIAVLITLLTSLACSVDLGNNDEKELALQQTAVALQQTQVALENASASAPEPTADEGTAAQPTTQAEVPTAQPDVTYEGISFSFDPSIAQGVAPETVEGQNMGEDSMPGSTYPTYYKFSFDNYAVADPFHTPAINVYPVEEYRAISSTAAEIINSLEQALVNRPGGGSISNLPFLPLWNAAQMFSAQVGYFDFQSGSGIRYLTMYGQALYPVDNQNLFYTFQGLTDDGRYYISAVLPVTHQGLPNDGSAQMDDWMAFEENWQMYINETLTWLNDQNPQSFFPSLSLLDAMMASFQIDR